MESALRLINSNLEVATRKDYINKSIMNEPKYGVLFYDYILSTVMNRKHRRGSSIIKGYITLSKHIEKFSKLNDVDIYVNSVNEEFMDDFIEYLQECNLKAGYIKNLVTMTQCLIRTASTHNYAIDPTYDEVSVEDEEPFSVYLSMNEITRIYYFKGLTKKQQRVRDLFVIGCLTALRYSDYSTLTAANFNPDCSYITKITKKTNKKVIIPVHDYVKEIVKKYENNIDFALSLQHFNRYLKMICKKIELNESITFSYTRGGKLITETKEKWELISSHTARRSAATNMYLTGRMKTFEIMQLTGHTTEKSFFRYIKITHEDVSKQIAGDSFFRK